MCGSFTVVLTTPCGTARIVLREIRAARPHSTILEGETSSVPGFGARRRAGLMVGHFKMCRRT